MTAETRGWWADEPAEESFAAGPAVREPAGLPSNAYGAAARGPTDPTHSGRLALGIALLAADRVRPTPAGPAFLTGVGLIVQTATEARVLARRAIGPPVRAAAIASAFAGTLPGTGGARRTLARSRGVLRRVATEARRRGEAVVAASRADAASFIQTSTADAITWAQATAAPQIVDGMVPHLVDEVVPRLIEGILPEIRTRVLPVVIDDLTNDPRVRELVVEQGRGVVGEAAQQLRATTASADERLESAFRRLVRSPAAADDALDTTGIPDLIGDSPAEVPLGRTTSPPPDRG